MLQLAAAQCLLFQTEESLCAAGNSCDFIATSMLWRIYPKIPAPWNKRIVTFIYKQSMSLALKVVDERLENMKLVQPKWSKNWEVNKEILQFVG